MNEGIITARYAKALYQTGEEEKQTEQISQDVQTLLDSIKESPEFSSFLQSPILKESEKASAIEKVFKGKLNDITYRFLLLLVKNRRDQFLASVCYYYQQLYRSEKGIREGVLITAHPMDKDHAEEVSKYIKKKFKLDIDFKELVDSSIIGGFKLRIDDKQIDASVASMIKKIRTQLNNS